MYCRAILARFTSVYYVFGWCALVCCSVGLCGMVGRLAFCPRARVVGCCSFGVRMARIGFMYADIYLYTVAVGVACGAFSRSCGGVVRLWLAVCVIAWFVPCGAV